MNDNFLAHFILICLSGLIGWILLSTAAECHDIRKQQDEIQMQLNDVVREIQLTQSAYADREYRTIMNAMSKISEQMQEDSED